MKVVKQEGLKDCGVCCLLSIIRHYQGNIPLEVLRELTNTTRNGVSAYNLVEAAIKIGFHSYGVKMDIVDVDQEMLPVIAHVILNRSYQHFIVIYEINQNKKELLIMDPAVGKKKLSFAEFNLMTSNCYIYLKPAKKILNLEKKKLVNEWVRQFIIDHKKYIPYILLLTFIYFFLNLIAAFYFKILLNKAIYYSITENVFLISKIFLIVFFLRECTLYLKSLTLLKWSELLEEKLTKIIFNRLMLLPYLYYRNRTTGEVISRIKDLEVIKSFLAKIFSYFLVDFAFMIIFLCILFSVNKKLGIFIILLSVLLFILEVLTRRPIIKNTNSYLKKCDKINSLLFENINSMSTIKSLHIEKKKLNAFTREYQLFLGQSYKLNNLILINNFFHNLINDLFMVVILTVGAILIINNQFNIGSLIVFQSILSYYLSSYQSILSIYKEYHKFRISKDRIEDLFMIRQENFNCLEYFQKYKLNGTIQIKNLTYSYGYQTIFKQLNLSIKRKDKIFFRGESGVGKSTLMKILSGFIHIDYGYISINSMDIAHYHLDTIRRRITYISQQENLFTGSIRENILFQEESEEKLNEICKLVRVDEIVDKDLGYSKMVEAQGENFSGGERQRIILARSIIKNSDIYIFDEALNQLDVDKEQEILKNILDYLKDKTVIVISHRLTCQNLFNRILTLQNGKIYEKI